MTENSLRRLRRAAGFTSAKAFAESIGIPGPTYTRYEQMEDGPDTGMPMKNAWAIADALGCSIDALVGREADVSERSESSKFLRQFEALSEDNRKLVAEFVELVGKHEEEERERRRAEIAVKYRPYLGEYLAQFLEHFQLENGEDAISVIGGEATFRALFQSFVQNRAELVLLDQQRESFEEARKVYEDLGYAVHEEFEPAYSAKKIMKGEDGYEEALEEVLEGVKEAFDRYALFQAKGVTDGIMAAYDEAYPQTGGKVDYAVMRMP